MGLCNCIQNYREKKELETYTAYNTEWLTLRGDYFMCKVIDVYDGDTVTVSFRYHGVPTKKKCRLSGIDTAEIRSQDEKEKKHARIAKDFLERLVLNKVVWIKCGDWDKYGRLLGTFYLERDSRVSINDASIRS